MAKTVCAHAARREFGDGEDVLGGDCASGVGGVGKVD